MWNRVTENDTPFAPFAFFVRLFSSSSPQQLLSMYIWLNSVPHDYSSLWLLVNPKCRGVRWPVAADASFFKTLAR